MDQVQSGKTFAQRWSLSFADLEFVNARPGSVRLGLAAQLKFFELNGFFVASPNELPGEALNYLAEQLFVGEPELTGYDFFGRTGRRHCADIRRYLGFSRMTRADLEAVSAWMSIELCPRGAPHDAMTDDVFLWCRDRKIFAPSRKVIERLVRSERQKFLDGYLASVTERLSAETVKLLEASLTDPESPTGFHKLKEDAGQATLENMLAVTQRLSFIQKLDLPRALLRVPGQAWIDQIVRRVSGEKSSEMRRHGRLRQLGLYAICLMAREAQLVDAVGDLLVETIHKIGTRSRRKVVARIAREIEKVYGKERLLAEIAGAAVDHPSGRICDVIFPVANEKKLTAIVCEYRAKGALDRRIYTVMRSSYAGHYRRMLPHLLSVLEFRSNNAAWRPVLDALGWIRGMQDSGRRFVAQEKVPTEVIPPKWRASIVDASGRVNRISYELCVLSQLRDRIRSKEIWIVGADRYRNPDDDLPKDFNACRAAYYSSLNLTQDARAFTNSVRSELERELRHLNAELPGNDKVRILWRGKNRISITPFDPAPEPVGLVSVKTEIARRWPMTGLLDLLKETALDTGFLDVFETSASRVALPRDVRDRRLLLCLYGLGTNAGLKRVAAGVEDCSYDGVDGPYSTALECHKVVVINNTTNERSRLSCRLARLVWILASACFMFTGSTRRERLLSASACGAARFCAFSAV